MKSLFCVAQHKTTNLNDISIRKHHVIDVGVINPDTVERIGVFNSPTVGNTLSSGMLARYRQIIKEDFALRRATDDCLVSFKTIYNALLLALQNGKRGNC